MPSTRKISQKVDIKFQPTISVYDIVSMNFSADHREKDSSSLVKCAKRIKIVNTVNYHEMNVATETTQT